VTEKWNWRTSCLAKWRIWATWLQAGNGRSTAWRWPESWSSIKSPHAIGRWKEKRREYVVLVLLGGKRVVMSSPAE
jgi:hypothetical protein